MSSRIDKIFINECKYCFKKFKRETAFKKHTCKEEEKFKLSQTSKGKLALKYYNMWRAKKGRRKIKMDSFLDGRYFMSMVEFVRFAKTKSIPNMEHYITYLTEKDILPNLWRNETFYEHYLLSFDDMTTPEEQASMTVETIFQLADIFQCETSEIFEHLMPVHVAKLIYAKKLSMCILAFSSKFNDYCRYRVSKQDLVLINNMVNKDKFKLYIGKNKKSIPNLKGYVKELGL